MGSLKEESIELHRINDKLKHDRLLRHEEQQNKRLQNDLIFQERMSKDKDEDIDELFNRLKRKEKIIKSFKNELDQITDFLRNYFVKDIALKILINNNEKIDNKQINNKILKIKNNEEAKQQVINDFDSILNQIFFDKKKYSDISLDVDKYSRINDLSESENNYEDKLKNSRNFLRTQLVKNQAYDETIAEMHKKWSKNEDVMDIDNLKKLFEEKIEELTKDKEFLNSINEKIEKNIDKKSKKDDNKVKLK